MHNIVSPKCSWGNFEQFKVHVSSRQKKKMVKSADFDGNMSIFWLKYILHMVLLHTRWLVSMGIFVLPFGPILNTVLKLVEFHKKVTVFTALKKGTNSQKFLIYFSTFISKEIMKDKDMSCVKNTFNK